MLRVAHPLNAAANSIFATKSYFKNTAAKSNQFDFAAVFLRHFLLFFDHKILLKHDFLVTHMCNKYLQKMLCLLCNNMSLQEELNKLTDVEKFKLIEF